MSGEQFTLTISQNASDNGDFAIHLSEQGKKKKEIQLLQIQFAEEPWFDETFMDELVASVARNLATRIIDKKSQTDNINKNNRATEANARKVVKDVLEKMRKYQ
ncbi:MAG: hypothetical protein KAG53_00700 [Endozoicomonadaceae bacterium]|nr:hypothetical protein [Endozoicomonadaceae bacterium]